MLIFITKHTMTTPDELGEAVMSEGKSGRFIFFFKVVGGEKC